MSRAGNQNVNGSVRCENIGGPAIQFVAGTNSGIFASILRNGVGDYTLTMLAGTPLAPTDFFQTQVEGVSMGFVVTNVTNPTTVDILVFDDTQPVPLAADLDFSLRVIERFFG